MVTMNWQLALVTFAMVPLMLILTNYWRKHVRTAYRATRTRLSLINGYLNESLSGIRVTQSFTREPVNYQHFADLNRSFFDANHSGYNAHCHFLSWCRFCWFINDRIGGGRGRMVCVGRYADGGDVGGLCFVC